LSLDRCRPSGIGQLRGRGIWRQGGAGYRTIFTPYAELYHYEFTSRGREEANEEKLRRWKREQALFMQR